MCEYDPTCVKADDPLAKPLWKRRGHAAFLVLCSKDYCPIAAVFDLPGRGRVLCAPAYKMLRRSVLVDTREGKSLEDPNGLHHMHAGVHPINDYGIGEAEYGRCRCGTWSFYPRTMDPSQWGNKHHRLPYVLAGYVTTADASLHGESLPEPDGKTR